MYYLSGGGIQHREFDLISRGALEFNDFIRPKVMNLNILPLLLLPISVFAQLSSKIDVKFKDLEFYVVHSYWRSSIFY